MSTLIAPGKHVADDIYGIEARWLIRAGLAVIVALVLGIGIWMVVTPLSGAAIAPGAVKVDMNRKTLQHQEGGIIKEILVRDGSHVEAGQTLLVINNVSVAPNYHLLLTPMDSGMAQSPALFSE